MSKSRRQPAPEFPLDPAIEAAMVDAPASRERQDLRSVASGLFHSRFHPAVVAANEALHAGRDEEVSPLLSLPPGSKPGRRVRKVRVAPAGVPEEMLDLQVETSGPSRTVRAIRVDAGEAISVGPDQRGPAPGWIEDLAGLARRLDSVLPTVPVPEIRGYRFEALLDGTLQRIDRDNAARQVAQEGAAVHVMAAELADRLRTIGISGDDAVLVLFDDRSAPDDEPDAWEHDSSYSFRESWAVDLDGDRTRLRRWTYGSEISVSLGSTPSGTIVAIRSTLNGLPPLLSTTLDPDVPQGIDPGALPGIRRGMEAILRGTVRPASFLEDDETAVMAMVEAQTAWNAWTHPTDTVEPTTAPSSPSI